MRRTILLASACVGVGFLAALGLFNSIVNFPIIFALVCLVLGAGSLWRERSQGSVILRAVILAAGASLAVSGWAYQGRLVEQRLEERRVQVLAELEGRPASSLAGLEPLNTDPGTWDEASAFSAKATVVTFWARWCSPCWKEMAELEELYGRYRAEGLSVVAVTRYDQPEDPEERRSDFAKAQKFLRQRGHTFPAAITDDGSLYEAYRVPSPPAAVLIGEDGIVIDYAIGLEDARVLMERAVALVGAGDSAGEPVEE